MDKAIKYSVIVPVYNRTDEVHDLLESLLNQSYNNFEVVIVEDGSTETCDGEADRYREKGLDIRYYFKDNEGRSIARNYGMERATGDYFVFFDSDCIIPQDYFKTIDEAIKGRGIKFFGGPDAAHESFSDIQKAINHTMTSFFTTGGIRGGKVNLEKFTPRTFNMGFSREVYDKTGGFREMFSEDIDMSTRIRQAGYASTLLNEAPVWHKRRVDFRKFMRQVYVFGMSRITLKLLYPSSLKAVHCLPAAFVVMALALLSLGIFVSPWYLLPIGIYAALIFADALIATRNLKIAALSVPAAAIQIVGYGTGFLKAYILKIVLGRGRDMAEEIEIRKGK